MIIAEKDAVPYEQQLAQTELYNLAATRYKSHKRSQSPTSICPYTVKC